MGIKDWLDDEQYNGLINEMELNDCLTGLDNYDRLVENDQWELAPGGENE